MGMPRGALGLGLTFFLACVSAAFFLQLRCQGKGRAFGPSSRWWALSVIGLTGMLSTGVAFALVTIGHQLPSAFASLGVVAPSGLWLGHIRQGTPERNSLYKAASTLWLTWLLGRMGEGMAEDKLAWCDRRVDPNWHADELILAARFYHDYLQERLTADDRRRYRIGWLMQNIEVRLDVVRLIDGSAGRSKVVAALKAPRLADQARYQRSLDDLTRLGSLLRHDAERDLGRMLAAAYNVGLYRLDLYTRPARAAQPQVQPAGPPWHP
jgi:hypothetical protein